MTTVVVRINNNDDIIKEVHKAKKVVNESENLLYELEQIQQNNLYQILAYIKCAYDDFKRIKGESLNKVFNVRYFYTISVRVINEKASIEFDYSGTLSKQQEPKRIEANFCNDNITITNSTTNGINDLMLYWEKLKPLFQEELERIAKVEISNANKTADNIKCQLENAKKFKL